MPLSALCLCHCQSLSGEWGLGGAVKLTMSHPRCSHDARRSSHSRVSTLVHLRNCDLDPVQSAKKPKANLTKHVLTGNIM